MRRATLLFVRHARSFVAQQCGATLLEYGAMLGLIAAVVVLAVVAVGNANNALLASAAAVAQ
jgi:Flp pilus assembly pilin Flp